MEKLIENQSLPKGSQLKPLSPFIDKNGILRVGGRLQKSEFSHNKQHPIIIPYGCHVVSLIIDEFWIMKAKRAVKAHVHKCVTCYRFKNDNINQLMGNLPSYRTKIVEEAFTYTGTDNTIWQP